jgi:uncharacterized protein (DUF2126 family)
MAPAFTTKRRKADEDRRDLRANRQPERIVITNGRWYEGNAVTELKRTFLWLPRIAG